jgi:hypothetical protein
MTSISGQREYIRIADGMHAARTRVYVRASTYSLRPIIGALLEFNFFSKINAHLHIRQCNSIFRFLLWACLVGENFWVSSCSTFRCYLTKFIQLWTN